MTEQQNGGGGHNGPMSHADQGTWISKFVAVLISVVVASVVIGLARPGTFFHSLREPSFARGVITFMVSMAAVTLGFVVVVYAFFGRLDEQSEARFRRAREIFVAMMGVLGTIVGYYFGQQVAPADLLEQPGIKLVENRGETTAMLHVNSGAPPYQYTVTFPGGVAKPIADSSADGWIECALPPRANQEFSILIRDANGRSVTTDYRP